jgi:branched-chain amino acid transport system permease protein
VDKFLTFTVLGLSQAAIFAIAASGLVLTYSTSGIFNFAHGAFGMLAAFTYWQVHVGWGVPTWPAFFLVVFVIAPLFGALVERVIMRGIEEAPEVVKIVVTVSLMVALLFLAIAIWPQDVAYPIGPLMEGGDLTIAGVVLPNQRLMTIAVAIAVAVGLWALLRSTRLGVAMRAVVDDRSLLQLNGGRPARTAMMSWAIGAGLAAISGVLLAAEQPPSAITLTFLVVNAYAAAVVGRLRSLPGAFIGAVILGLAISYTSAYLPAGASIGAFSLSGLPRAVPAIMLFIVIVAQPEARLRAHSVTRTRRIAVPSQRSALIGGVVLVLVVAAVGSMIAGPDLPLVSKALWFALITVSLVPLTGYAGQISLAQLTFTGIGAVAMATWGANGSPLAVGLSIALCAVVGAVVALPALRLSGIYLALATAAFAIFCTWMVFSQRELLTGGTVAVPPLNILGWEANTQFRQLVLTAVAFAVIANILVVLRRSSWGRRLAAMRDSPVACATLGLNLTATKVGVFALSAAIAGSAGALAGRTFVSDDFGLTPSLQVTMLAVVGGVGSIAGALMGGLTLGMFPIASSVFAANAIGVFRFVTIPVTKVITIMPGFMGIQLGRNPDGASSEIARSYRALVESVPASVATGVAVVMLWVAARLDYIEHWSFVAALVVILFAVMPLVGFVLPPAGVQMPGRRWASGIWMVLAVIVTAALPWETLVASNGLRILLMLIWAGLVAGVAVGIHGEMDLAELGLGSETAKETESPDFIGLGTTITDAEAFQAGAEIGLNGELSPDKRLAGTGVPR